MGIETLKEELAFGRLVLGAIYGGLFAALLVYYQAFQVKNSELKLYLLLFMSLFIILFLIIYSRYYRHTLKELEELEASIKK